MVTNALLMVRLFPFDPAIDTSLGHRNLLLVYCAVWGLHLAYLLYAVAQWKALKGERASVDTSEDGRS